MLYLAMSCLQGRLADDAARDLLALRPDGLQLTPGNHPQAGFAERVARSQVVVRTHQGYTPHAYRGPVWTGDGALACDSDSVHPPEVRRRGLAPPPFSQRSWLEGLAALEAPPAVEVMYPGQWLGSGREIRDAMAMGLWLAVDVSHVAIQRRAGTIQGGDWRLLSRYQRIAEVHLSTSVRYSDAHRPISDATFGLGWARERAADGVPVVLECYMHRLGVVERREQVERVRELLRGPSPMPNL